MSGKEDELEPKINHVLNEVKRMRMEQAEHLAAIRISLEFLRKSTTHCMEKYPMNGEFVALDAMVAMIQAMVMSAKEKEK